MRYAIIVLLLAGMARGQDSLDTLCLSDSALNYVRLGKIFNGGWDTQQDADSVWWHPDLPPAITAKINDLERRVSLLEHSPERSVTDASLTDGYLLADLDYGGDTVLVLPDGGVLTIDRSVYIPITTLDSLWQSCLVVDTIPVDCFTGGAPVMKILPDSTIICFKTYQHYNLDRFRAILDSLKGGQ